MEIKIGAVLTFSFLGKRIKNEDYIYPTMPNSNSQLFIVCDGIGGWAKGEEASRIVGEELFSFFDQHPTSSVTLSYLMDALNQVQLSLTKYLSDHPMVSKMGSTLALLHLTEAGVSFVHLGDSRIYWIRNDQILHKTQDHRYILDLIANGVITTEQAQSHPRRNTLSKAIFAQNSSEVTSLSKPTLTFVDKEDLRVGDYFFLCTDGVLENINDFLLTDILSSSNTNEDKVTNLLKYCDGKTSDNYSGILIQVASHEKQAPPLSYVPKSKVWNWIGLSLLWFFIAYCPCLADTYAVAIGISDYKVLNYRTGDLNFADKDALRFVSFLKSEAGGSVSLNNIRILTNRQATKRAILEVLLLFKNASKSDRIIFYFSGHGTEGAFIPYDGNINSNTHLTHQEIKAMFKMSAASTKICIADACFSGGMVLGRSIGMDSSPKIDKSQYAVAFILSSRATQASVEYKRIINGGIFSFFLMKGLNGKADSDHNQIVSIQELYQYVAPRVKKYTPNKQAPIFVGNFPDELPMAYIHRNR
jgi:serine/threonine protein phosphatase PrpC